MKIKAIFSKTGAMRFISHLDLMRLFQRAMRRADLPVVITKGFSPHLRISMPRALKLGLESDSEELTVSLSAAVTADGFMKSMNNNLPGGVRILKVMETR